MNAICVYAGSSREADGAWKDAAAALGAEIAGRGLGVVYGGGRLGLMGALADGALGLGGRVVGVIPSFMAEKDLAHPRLTEIRVVATMHERKATMVKWPDPGGE